MALWVAAPHHLSRRHLANLSLHLSVCPSGRTLTLPPPKLGNAQYLRPAARGAPGHWLVQMPNVSLERLALCRQGGSLALGELRASLVHLEFE